MEEKIKGKEVSMPETGTVTVTRHAGSDDPEERELELEPGERLEIEGPDGFVLAYAANYGVEPEEESGEE